jgi:RimJ/RimL family protein N-acetyltransferase
LTPPDLRDDVIRLVPLARALAPRMQWVLEHDPDTAAFTYIPTHPDAEFLERWLGRYEDGWATGDRAGFAAEAGRELVAFAAFVQLDDALKQGEIGYVVAPAGRGRGIATRAVSLLTAWGLGDLGLQRIELRIDPRNTGSEKVAERCGYMREGTLRNLAFKEGMRCDLGIWSRLPSDPA